MKNYMRITATLVFLMVVISSVAFGAELLQPNLLTTDSNIHIKVGKQIKKYIGNKFTGDFIYKGKLINQMNDVSTLNMGGGNEGQIKLLGNGVYLISFYQYKSATVRRIVVIDQWYRILLVSLGVASEPYGRSNLDVFVRDRKNLKYLPALKKWFYGQAEDRDQTNTNLYDLNCKSIDIMKCKIN